MTGPRPDAAFSRRSALAAFAIGGVTVPALASPALAAPSPAKPPRPAPGPLTPIDAAFEPEVPKGLTADVVPAAYEQVDPNDPDNYGSYSLAARGPGEIDSIIIHDTEVDYETTLAIFTNVQHFASIHYVIQEDGHITQMVRTQDVAWHAGNWTFNGSSIGIELIGVAEDPSHYTDAQYRATGKLIRYLTDRYDIPRDRDHILAHEDLPGVNAARQAAMHWDPGAYYDYEKLLRHAGADDRNGPLRERDETVTIAPSYKSNELGFTSCNPGGGVLAPRSTSAVMVRTEPSDDAPFLEDPALAAVGAGGSDRICDWGAQVSYGQTYAVADRTDGWMGLWIAGTVGWVRTEDENGKATVRRGPRDARRVTPRRGTVATYGTAYPTPEAFAKAGFDSPARETLPYELLPGQEYVVEDVTEGAYYWSTRFDGSGGGWVRDSTQWIRIQSSHRSAFVRAEDVVDV